MRYAHRLARGLHIGHMCVQGLELWYTARSPKESA